MRRELPLEAQVLMIVTICLVVFGQLMVYSASSAYAMTHAEFGFDSLYFVKSGVLYTLAGVALMIGMIFVPAGWLRKAAPIVFIASLVGLAAVRLPGVGVAANGASRWLAVGPLTVQPSEFAKLGTLLIVAVILAHRAKPPQTLRDLLFPLGVLVGLVCALIMIQPDLGTSLVIGAIGFGVLFVSGASLRWLGLTIVGLVAALPFIWAEILKDYQKERLIAFLDPEADPLGSGSQLLQARLAVSSGGIFGKGLTNGSTGADYLPVQATDFVFEIGRAHV